MINHKPAGGSKRQTDIINYLAIALRSAEIHDLKNVAVIKAVNTLVLLTTSYLKHENPIVLELRGDFFFMNELRIRYSPDVIYNLDYLVRLFRSYDLGTLIIRPGISQNDIILLFSLLLKKPSDRSFQNLRDHLSSVAAIDVEVLKKIPEEDMLDARKMVKKSYFKAVSFTKGIMNKIQEGEEIALKKAKRMVISLVDHIMEEEQLLLGMTSIKDYDEYTYHHSVNVSILSIALGQRLGMHLKQLTELGMVALFHDIGKLDIPYAVLNKTTPLTDEDWKIIQRHPLEGVRLLLKMKHVDMVTIHSAIVSFEHHMFYNHTGYPKVNSPFELDLFSRIISIADQYDAMTSARVYSRKAMSPDNALNLMMQRSGKQLDPLILKFFVNMVGIYPIGTMVMLDSNELGIVTESSPVFVDKPRIMILTDTNRKKVEPYGFDLSETDHEGNYSKSIVKTVDDKKYKIKVADYLL